MIDSIKVFIDLVYSSVSPIYREYKLFIWTIIVCLCLGAIVIIKKNVQAEIKEFFSPIFLSSKRKFILFLIIIIIIVLSLVNLVFCLIKKEQFRFDRDIIYAFLGLAFTVFFCVIVVLKTSVNNIGRLLSRISYMVEGDANKVLYMILPTPFLGYLDYKAQYAKIDKYLKVANQYQLAILDWEPKGGQGINIDRIKAQLNEVYVKQKESLDETKWVNKLSPQKIEEKAKEKSWRSFVNWASCNKLPDLFQFHLDEIQLTKKTTDSEKYDYFIKACEFIQILVDRNNKSEDLMQLKKLAISYSYEETVFPVILINKKEQKILHGTTRVESQFKVRFEGDAIVDNNLSNNAEKLFDAYIV